MKKILGLTCTNGRFSYLRRLLTCFLKQTYENKVLLIYNNAKVPIKMDPISNVILINNYKDFQTNDDYKDVGSIYRDALTYCPEDIDYVSIMDDDDIFLPDHFSRGVKVLQHNSKYKIWRPRYYYYREKVHEIVYSENKNHLEGSCIINFDFLKSVGFEIGSSLSYNLKWLQKGIQEGVLTNDTQLEPTFCCEYGQSDVIHSSIFSTYHPDKDRGAMEKEIAKFNNFGNDQLLTPWSNEEIEFFFNLYFNFENYKDV